MHGLTDGLAPLAGLTPYIGSVLVGMEAAAPLIQVTPYNILTSKPPCALHAKILKGPLRNRRR
jgi:hypothetical protein